MSKRGENIRKRKDNRWEARLIIGYRQDGKAQYRYLYGKTYAEAKKAKQDAMAGLKAVPKIKQPIGKTTVSELSHLWLAQIKDVVKESTYARYNFVVEKYIITHLGVKPVTWLENNVIDEFAHTLLTKGKSNGGGLAPKSVTDILAVLKLIIKYAIEHKYEVPVNMFIRQPKRSLPEIQVISHKNQEYLETFLIGSDELSRLGILFCLYTGLRIGELCSLRWEDFNFSDNTVNISRTITRIQDISPNAPRKTKIIIDRPKTDCSIRSIPLPEFMVNYIKKFKRGNDTYFLTGTTHYIEPRSYFNIYRRILKDCGLDAYTFHALRHTFATRCVEKGFDIKSLSEILGHADVKTTLERYVHPSMEMKRSQMDKLSSKSFSSQMQG